MNRLAIVEYLSNKIKYTEDQKELIKAIDEAKEEMERAAHYFEQVSTPELVDYAIYMDQAAKSRFVYLLKEAKEKGIKVDNSFKQYQEDIV
ncbi:hypothetical protein HMPREF1982_01961 [Clostridiales bacterium oral taxon 876 str. F0540]|nr:hypothetical protein HMPREF1982_01961 [Clostridiales bacterium oral taxon 876 str. F0540]